MSEHFTLLRRLCELIEKELFQLDYDFMFKF